MTAQFGFDTLSFVKRLTAAGIDNRHAEAIVEGMTAYAFNDLATKADLLALKAELKSDIQDLRSELKSDIQDLRSELKSDIQDIRSLLNNLELRLTIRMGVILGAGIAILAAVIKLT